MQANIHSGSVLNYPGRLVGVHRSANIRSGNHGTTRNAEHLQSTGGSGGGVREDISTVTALQQQIISTVASVEINERKRGGDDQQPEDATEMDVTGLGAGGDSDQRMLLGGGGGGGVVKEGSVGKKTGSKQKKIFIRNSAASAVTTAVATGDQSSTNTTTTTTNGGGGNKEKPLVTILTIGNRLDSTTMTMSNGGGGERRRSNRSGEDSEEDKIDILAHL